MKIAALEELLSNPSLAGSQSFQILEKFLLLAKLVRDPLNVFRYMEEKSICTYFPFFWYSKSQYLAEIGDYRNAFLCLSQADSRKNIEDDDVSLKYFNTDLKAKIYRDQISSEMLKYPPNKRRTISDFNVMTKKYEDLPGTDQQKMSKLLTLMETKFPILRTEKEKIFLQKNQDKPRSWLSDKYEKQEKKMFQIMSETYKIFNNEGSNQSMPKNTVSQETQERLFRSHNTPSKRPDTMKMTKTLDSVQMIRRKKRTDEVQKKQNIFFSSSQRLQEKPEDQEQHQNEEESRSICINTVPVGKPFVHMKKGVRFQNQNKSSKIERPRENNHFSKEEDIMQVSRSTSLHRRGILRNKSVQKKQSGAPQFSQITQKSLQIKKTEQHEI